MPRPIRNMKLGMFWPQQKQRRKGNTPKQWRHTEQLSYPSFNQLMVYWVVKPIDFIKKLGEQLFVQWEKPYAQVMNWVWTRLLFATIRATNLCLRGSRVKRRSGIGLEDGADMPFNSD